MRTPIQSCMSVQLFKLWAIERHVWTGLLKLYADSWDERRNKSYEVELLRCHPKGYITNIIHIPEDQADYWVAVNTDWKKYLDDLKDQFANSSI